MLFLPCATCTYVQCLLDPPCTAFHTFCKIVCHYLCKYFSPHLSFHGSVLGSLCIFSVLSSLPGLWKTFQVSHISNSELWFLHFTSLSQVVFHFLMLFLPLFSICLDSGKYINLSLSFQNSLRTALWSSSCTHPSSQRVCPVGVALVVFWGTGLPFSVDSGCSEVCCWNVSITIDMPEIYVLAHKP